MDKTKTEKYSEIANDVQIGDFAQFIDILEIIERYDNIEDVKMDIAIRKKYMRQCIEEMEKALSKLKFEKNVE